MAKKIETIKKIKVRGFKSIMDEQEIELRPLTLLAGANSSGKSSIMQPILLLKQTIEAQSDPGALLLDGPNVRYTKAEQLLSQVPRQESAAQFFIGIHLQSSSFIDLVFGRKRGVGFDLSEMKYSDGNKVIRIVPGMSNDDISTVIPEQLKDVFEVFASKNYRWTVYRDRCFFAFDLYIPETRQRLGAVFPGIAGFGTLFNAEFISHLKSIIHLPGLRGNPSRTYLKNAAGPDFPGTFENYVASTLSDWQQKKDSRLSEVGGALEEMGLTWKVRAEPVDDTQVELKVGRLPHSRRSGAHDLVSIADVSIGVSQVLPVVVALIVAKSGQIVYLEQPEIHLHPRAQRKLAHVINNAVKRNVVVVVETHSSLLLREIQTLVAKSELSPEKVALHWFQRQDDGRTVITSADLDENGAYGPWPEDFDEVELKAEKDYLDAVESREARG